jgi:5-methylcytosine-specific restriction endonuclease McrA
MILEAEFRKRVNQTYANMTTRAKPRLWKNGKKKGKVRVPGLASLPFWKDDLWKHVTAQIPEGGALCPYCKDYGRSTLIYLDTFVLDHHIPIKLLATGLYTREQLWALSNLVCVCADCNTVKGSMSYTAFIVLMRDFLPDFEPSDQKYIVSCLRTHGLVMRGWGGPKKPPAELLPLASPIQRRLEEEF